jgi:hypothetical protein
MDSNRTENNTPIVKRDADTGLAAIRAQKQQHAWHFSNFRLVTLGDNTFDFIYKSRRRGFVGPCDVTISLPTLPFAANATNCSLLTPTTVASSRWTSSTTSAH